MAPPRLVIYPYAMSGELRRRCKGPISLIDTPYRRYGRQFVGDAGM